MKWWHEWRAGIWGERLAVAAICIPTLERCDRDYRSSYYSDKLLRAIEAKAVAEYWLQYHRDRY